MADDSLNEPSQAAPSARERKKMTDEDLLLLIFDYSKKALGSEVSAGAAIGQINTQAGKTMTSLEIDRYNALNTYFARPFGNETETSSQVVVPEFRDTVEWIMPELMRIFVAAKTPCVFDPEGPDDVQQAEEETQAVAHVFMRLNEGFFVIHDYIKDALILRNGYVRVEAEEDTQTSEENYSGLNEFGVTQLLQEKQDGKAQVEVIGQNEETVMQPPPEGAPPGTPDQQVQSFDVKLRIKRTVKKVIVEALPPEEMRIAAGHRSNDLDKCAFVEHKTKRTRSQLKIEGFDPAVVDAAAAVPDDWFEMDALARNQVVDQLQTDTSTTDKSQENLNVRNVTVHVDFDGDGVSERRQVVVIGNKIASNDVVEECPVASGVPKRMPHRHTGISLYDELLDIQIIKSELMRQGLNSLRLSINPRIGVDWKRASISDLMTWRTGGLIRTDGPPQNALFPFSTPNNTMDQVLPMMEAVDQWRAMRTGVGKNLMGLDPEALQDVTKSGQLAAMSAASLKVEMVARLLAEGLKDVFLKIHALLIRHQDQPMRFQMGNQWVQTDPRKWRKRSRVSPNVGLGSGNREEARANFMLLGQMMKEAGAAGLVSPKQVWNAFKMGVTLLGYEHPESYAMDPASAEFKQWQQQQSQQHPDPKVQVATINANSKREQVQADMAEARMEQQTEAMRSKAEMAHDALQNREDRQVSMADLDSKITLKLLEIISRIASSQLSGDPSVNAGQVLRQDLQSLKGGAT